MLQYKTQMLFVTAEMTKGHLQTLSKLNSPSYSKWNRTQWGSSPAYPLRGSSGAVKLVSHEGGTDLHSLNRSKEGRYKKKGKRKC